MGDTGRDDVDGGLNSNAGDLVDPLPREEVFETRFESMLGSLPGVRGDFRFDGSSRVEVDEVGLDDACHIEDGGVKALDRASAAPKLVDEGSVRSMSPRQKSHRLEPKSWTVAAGPAFSQSMTINWSSHRNTFSGQTSR